MGSDKYHSGVEYVVVNDVKKYTMQTRGFPPTQRAKKNNGGYDDEKLKPVESTALPSVNIVLHNLLGRLTYKDSSGRERHYLCCVAVIAVVIVVFCSFRHTQVNDTGEKCETN